MTQAPLSTGPRDGDRLVQLAGGSALNLLGTVVRQVSIFGITLVLARWLGASAVGEYSQAYTIHALVVLASLVGMRIAMTHFVATFRADGDFGAVKGVVRIGLGVSGFMSVALAIVVFVSADLVATEYLADPDIAPLIRLQCNRYPIRNADDDRVGRGPRDSRQWAPWPVSNGSRAIGTSRADDRRPPWRIGS